MARAIDANELEMFPYSEGAGTEEQIADWIEQVGLSEDDTASRARDLCWKVIDGFINVVKTQPTLSPQNEPLTQEQLRELDGVNALWVHFLAWNAHKPRLMLVRKTMDSWWSCCDHNGFLTFSEKDYGNMFLLYRRPPEGEP